MTSRSPRPRRARATPPRTSAPVPMVTAGPGHRTCLAAGPGPVVGSLCTGYGGLDLGVLTALGGGRIAWVADPDPHISQIIQARMPGVPNLGDLRSIDWPNVEPVDVVVAGFPCQDISAAGKRAGIEKGVRSGLWTDIVAGLRLLRPALVVVENVAALRWRNGGLHRVLGDLAAAGYDALWRSVRAADIGAAHRRERVFVLAWPRRRRAGRHDGDIVAGTDHARLLVLWHQRHSRRAVAAGLSAVVAHPACLGHRDSGPQGRSWVPPAVVTAGAPAGRSRGVAPDTTRDGRDEGLPSPARVQGRPDAALSGPPPGHPTSGQPDTRQRDRRPRDRRQFVACPAFTGESASVDWGVYETAIRRWETILGRPAPHPTRPGNHGRPVLAPAFVEHLMGLTEGWVTDLPLPRTAQLRALGNGVVPQQAAHAIALLLNDLAELLDIHTDWSQNGQEVSAA
jgi:DNA (cytosine-5)-methyltransferase 1